MRLHSTTAKVNETTAIPTDTQPCTGLICCLSIIGTPIKFMQDQGIAQNPTQVNNAIHPHIQGLSHFMIDDH